MTRVAAAGLEKVRGVPGIVLLLVRDSSKVIRAGIVLVDQLVHSR